MIRMLKILTGIGRIACFVLLWNILYRGIYSLLKSYLNGDWVFENEDGERSDLRSGFAGLSSFALMIWVLVKYQRAKMSDKEKQQSDRASESGRNSDLWRM